MSVKKILLAAAIAALPIFADAVPTDGTWNSFQFSGADTFAFVGSLYTVNPVGVLAGVAPWTFSGPADVTVLDLQLSVDQFELFDNDVSLGITSVPISDPFSSCGLDVGCALADPKFSRGVFSVGDGAHSLTIKSLFSTGLAHGAFRVSSVNAVPEPSAFLLLGTGIAAFALYRRRRA